MAFCSDWANSLCCSSELFSIVVFDVNSSGSLPLFAILNLVI